MDDTLMGVGSHNGSVLSFLFFGKESSKINTQSHFWQNFPFKKQSSQNFILFK